MYANLDYAQKVIKITASLHFYIRFETFTNWKSASHRVIEYVYTLLMYDQSSHVRLKADNVLRG